MTRRLPATANALVCLAVAAVTGDLTVTAAATFGLLRAVERHLDNPRPPAGDPSSEPAR